MSYPVTAKSVLDHIDQTVAHFLHHEEQWDAGDATVCAALEGARHLISEAVDIRGDLRATP